MHCLSIRLKIHVNLDNWIHRSGFRGEAQARGQNEGVISRWMVFKTMKLEEIT